MGRTDLPSVQGEYRAARQKQAPNAVFTMRRVNVTSRCCFVIGADIDLLAMLMTPRLRKFALLAHITFSVGWLGAVVAYLALAIAGLTSQDAQLLRAVFPSMELIGWFVIVPFSFATLFTGLLQSLGTRWGLFRHWWILVKVVLAIVATAILLRHMQDVSRVSRLAKVMELSSAEFRPELIHAGGGLLVLLAATALSVFKPWGMTPWAQRQESPTYPSLPPTGGATPARGPALAASAGRWPLIIGVHAIVFVLLFAVLHLRGLHHHH